MIEREGERTWAKEIRGWRCDWIRFLLRCSSTRTTHLLLFDWLSIKYATTNKKRETNIIKLKSTPRRGKSREKRRCTTNAKAERERPRHLIGWETQRDDCFPSSTIYNIYVDGIQHLLCIFNVCMYIYTIIRYFHFINTLFLYY